MPFFWWVFSIHMEIHEIYLSHGFQGNSKENVSAIRLVWVYFFFIQKKWHSVWSFRLFTAVCERIYAEIICIWQDLGTCCSRLLPGAWWHCQSPQRAKGASGAVQNTNTKQNVCVSCSRICCSVHGRTLSVRWRLALNNCWYFPFSNWLSWWKGPRWTDGLLLQPWFGYRQGVGAWVEQFLYGLCPSCSGEAVFFPDGKPGCFLPLWMDKCMLSTWSYHGAQTWFWSWVPELCSALLFV